MRKTVLPELVSRLPTMHRFRASIRTAIILATMSFGPMLAANMLGMLHIDNSTVLQERQMVCQKLATSVSNFLSTKDEVSLQRACRSMVIQVDDLRSVRVVRYDGINLYCSPDHSNYWTLKPDDTATIDQMRVPLNRDGRTWAELEIAFDSKVSTSYAPWIRWGLLIGIGFILNFGSFSIFLGRLMKGIDTKNAVPKRVRNTLDTIVGGVVILDKQGKILLANESFAECVGRPAEELPGSALADLPWKSDTTADWPWDFAIRECEQVTAAKINLTLKSGAELSFMVNATPVLDAKDELSGALISFENISLMETQRKELVQTLNALEASQEQIRRQNEILHELASRDGLTGAYNRRALFEKVEAIWANRNDGDFGLVTIMMDVDHFKKLNDQHGHATGDAVLKDVVRIVQDIVDTRGVAARYGGEEFCVAMERATLDEGIEMAEKIRAGIQGRLETPYHVTASIGVSSSIFGAKSLQSLIEQSDKGLYAAKHGGRNAVRCWSEQLERDAEEAERKKEEKLAQTDIEDHPISYHAVVALSAAIGHYDPRVAAHSHRVAEMAVNLGRGLMDVESLYVLEIACLLHDVGIIGQQSGRSTLGQARVWSDDYLRQMADRNRMGLEISKAALHSKELIEILQFQWLAFQSVSELNLQSSEIPLGARILAVVNAYDELTSELNESPLDHDSALVLIREMAGRELDPELVERFIASPLGWRPYGLSDESMIEDKQAVMLGYQLERVLNSFHARNPNTLKSRLQTLSQLAKSIDMPAMAVLVHELNAEAERKAISDWESLLPLIEDLVELCLMIQRSYLRSSRVCANTDRPTAIVHARSALSGD